MPLVFLDSSIVICLIERHPAYARQIERALTGDDQIIPATSRLTHLEVLVKPLQSGHEATTDRYRTFLEITRPLSIKDETFNLALELRVRHHLKTPDALHLAVTQQYRCAALWTNDDRLAKATGRLSVNILASSSM